MYIKYFAIILFSLAINLHAQDSIFANLETPVFKQRTIKNNAFKIGEKLSFVVRYGIIHAGDATMSVKDTVKLENGHNAYLIETTASTKKAFDIFYKVRDRVESWVDTKGLFSWKFNKYLREGSYKFDLNVDYDQDAGKAQIQTTRYKDDDDTLTIRKQKNFSIDIPPNVLDILASFYYVRTQRLRLGDPLYITNHDNDKIYDLKVIIQKREIVKVKAGKFRCIMVEPMLKGDAIFKQKGRLWIWLSDDEYKIPVQMKSAVFFGKITTELTNIEGIPLPLPSQIK